MRVTTVESTALATVGYDKPEHCCRVEFTLGKGESVEGRRLTPEDACASEMLALIRWQVRKMAVPLAQLIGLEVHPCESSR